MRLNKFLARCGVASRRSSDLLINNGKVTVNGKLANAMGIIINPDKDIVTCNGVVVEFAQDIVYYMLNKPKGYVTTVTDPYNRPTVMQLLSGINLRVFPIGRLDFATEGLLLITNDGDLTNKLTHPSHNIQKIYQVTVTGTLNENNIKELESGMVIDGYKTAPASVEIITQLENSIDVNVKIHEGRNRQVRKMFEQIGKEITHLKRVQIGEIKLGKLKRGEYRALTKDEINYLKNIK
ncbi:MAG: pseudouridine synthase [Clostridia bacterium]